MTNEWDNLPKDPRMHNIDNGLYFNILQVNILGNVSAKTNVNIEDALWVGLYDNLEDDLCGHLEMGMLDIVEDYNDQ